MREVACGLALMLALAAACRSAPPQSSRAITLSVTSPQRPPEDLPRDQRDRPIEVLEFFGLAIGMSVLDLNSATGYYTELLARSVGPQGHVVAHNHPGAAAMLGKEALSGRYRDGRLPNVTPLLARHGELQLERQSLDMVLMSMVYHDTYWYQAGVDWGPVDQQALLKNLYDALRPGGVVGVIDHVADAGAFPRTSVMALHRIDPQAVRRDFRRAGFVLEAESDLLRNPADDRALGVFDPAVQGRTDRFVMRFRKPANWTLPAGVPPPRVPDDAPVTPARVELGRHLFYDTRLSGNGQQSCASCHIQALAFTDGRAQAVGSTGQTHPRSAMSLINVAYRDALTWANPELRTLEQQIAVPLFGTSPVEMGQTGHEVTVFRNLRQDRTYRRLFTAAFPGEAQPVDTRNVTIALAAFLRSIVSFRSPFDRFRFASDTNALSLPAQRGMRLFFGTARCGGCHMAQNVTVDLGLNLDGGSKSANSPADEPEVFMFHNTGLYNLPGPMSYPADNTGLYAHTHDVADMGKFRIPTLRNIALTAPYMHDGSIPTLDAVLDHYAAGGRAPGAAHLSDSIKPLQLTATDRSDLIAFLESLTDEAALMDPRWSDPWPACGDSGPRQSHCSHHQAVPGSRP